MNRETATSPSAPLFAKPETGSKGGRSSRQALPCPTCGVENDAKDSFCHMCGAALQNTPTSVPLQQDICRYCGKLVPEKDAFCPHCGRRHREPHLPTPPGGMPPVTPPVVRSASENFYTQSPSSTGGPGEKVAPALAPVVTPFAGSAAPVPAPSPSPGQLYFAAPPSISMQERGCSLFVLQGHRTGERFPFTKSITLGRHVGEILFPNDEYLDSRHLVVNTMPDGVLLQDMNTVNGIYYLSPSDTEITPGNFFIIDDILFQFVEVTAAEWSLVNVWERGVKLLGTLRSDRPWGRLLIFSPQGSVAASFLLWQETVYLENYICSPPVAVQASTCLINRKGSALLRPGNREIFIRIRGQQSFKLPVRLRMGLQVIEIQAS